MANNHFSFLFFFLSFFLFLSDCSKKVEKVYGFEEKSVNPHMHVFEISSLAPENVCSTPAEGSKTSSKLQAAYKYGPCSPLKRGNTTPPTLHQIILQDQIRIKSIHSKISNQPLVSNSGAKLPAFSGSGDYVVTVGFGTPEQSHTVIFDTGSDLAWLQCQPCTVQCLSQQDPYFDPSSSSTYSNIPCHSKACSELTSATGYTELCTTDCIYLISYGDGSYTGGYFATDKLTLSSSAVFPNFEFGCGEDQGGDFGSVDGLLGLGRNNVSIVSQTAHKYGKIFSYCLPSTSSYTGFLAFGNQAVASSGVKYTPLLTESSYPSFYFLDLIGISVGGKMLSIFISVFKTSGIIIDSGTTITYLPPTAYSALRSAFHKEMSNHTMISTYSIFDTCYDLSEYDTVTIPTIVLHFGGGTDLNVDMSGILIEANSSQYCLAFAGNSADTDLSILGNTQQKTFEVIYDVTGGKLGFSPKGCN